VVFPVKEKTMQFLASGKGKIIVFLAMLTGGLATPVIAGATTYDPTSDATSLATNAGTLAGPVIVAVAAALIGLVVLLWAVRFVYGLLKGGRH
jgi:hypothetical protein